MAPVRADDTRARPAPRPPSTFSSDVLPDTVAADETDLVAGAQREGRVGQRVPATHLDREIAHLEHR